MKGELILARDYAPRFAMPLAEKDQRLVQEAATELGAKVPVNEVVRRNFAASCESGRADKDWSAVGDLYLGWSGKTA